MSIFIPSKVDVIDFEDEKATIAAVAGTTGNSVVSKTLRNNFRCFVAFVGQAWDPAIDTFVTWRFKVNDQVVYQLRDSTVQIAPPEQPWQELTPWIEVPQGSTVKIEADLAVGGGNGNITGRIRVYYVPLN